jgi:hypothetical protein
MGTGHHEGRARRWVAVALGGVLFLGVLGARAVPPPPPLLKVGPRAPAASKDPEPPPATKAMAEEEESGAGPAMIWLLPMAGQLSGAPNAGE